ncbi:hypothetical protein PFNF135_06088 [Plasmodium falciparum NF135/5.C10]|uniref:Uncharacterized protein n=1 Tax=Plasmodium falciparum NF135/5.C10 TaxID=1036726 RepID=W4I8N1_PLAFA|nr:hypothetical protein PFNF135_06088 [Plasmodium falciparum NF135/5.C10]
MNCFSDEKISLASNSSFDYNKVDEENIRRELGSITKDYDYNNVNIDTILNYLNYYKKNITNINILCSIKDITICFIKNIQDDIRTFMENDTSNFLNYYLKGFILQNFNVLGSYKYNMYLNNYINIDIGIEYNILNIQEAEHCNYQNFYIYHNKYINILKSFFYNKNFAQYIKEANIHYNLDLSIGVRPFINLYKSILVINISKQNKYIGSIHLILYPSNELSHSLYNVYHELCTSRLKKNSNDKRNVS